MPNEDSCFTHKYWGREVKFKYRDTYLDWRKANGADWVEKVRGKVFISNISAVGTVYIEATGEDAPWDRDYFELVDE